MFLGVSANMTAMDADEGRARLGVEIQRERRARFGTVEKARIAANVNRATWDNAEQGKRLREDRLAAIERALGWQPGTAWKIMAGDDDLEERRPTAGTDVRTAIENDPLLDDRLRRLLLAQYESMLNEMANTAGEGQAGETSRGA